MGQYLIDTNIISDYFTSSLNDIGLDFVSEILDDVPKISFITQIELLSWNTSKEIENGIREFLSYCEVIYINLDIIESCVLIRKNKNLKTPDAIIASTAVSLNLKIITNNSKDFINIKNLKVVNPYNL
jgi:predicted nucleic acid-binding protein